MIYRIFTFLFQLPNMPFYLLFNLWVFYNVVKNNSLIDVLNIDTNSKEYDDMFKNLGNIYYPKPLRIFVALSFYFIIIKLLIK